jgi:hypothetical protein
MGAGAVEQGTPLSRKPIDPTLKARRVSGFVNAKALIAHRGSSHGYRDADRVSARVRRASISEKRVVWKRRQKSTRVFGLQNL